MNERSFLSNGDNYFGFVVGGKTSMPQMAREMKTISVLGVCSKMEDAILKDMYHVHTSTCTKRERERYGLRRAIE